MPATVLIAAALVVCGLLATRLGYVPIWDGRIYAACIAAAAEKLTFESFRCAGHASQAYVSIAALAQRIAPSSTVPVVAFNGLLLFIAAAGFYRLAQLAFPNVDRLDRALLTAAFMLQPAFLASVVQPGLDFPLVPAFVWCVVFAVERRRTWLVASGLWLAFTKETGLLLYAVILGCHALWLLFKWRQPIGARVAEILRLAPLALPGVVFIAYLAYRKFTVPNAPPMWYGSTNEVPLIQQLLVPRLDLYQVNYAVILLVLNFAWIPWGVTAFDAFVGTVRTAHREAKRPLHGANPEIASLLIIIVLATAYAITRFTTYGHPRYFLSVYAVALFPFYAALLRFDLPRYARQGTLALYALLLVASAVRSIDPLSRRLYGTFPFGEHRLFRMTRITGEGGGFGQDQLVYNLEFTAVQTLVEDALTPAAASAAPIIVVPDSTSWIFLDPPMSGARLFDNRGWKRPGTRVYEHRQLVRDGDRPDSVLYLALPHGDNARAIRELSVFYDFRDEHRYSRSGYALSTYRLVRRNP